MIRCRHCHAVLYQNKDDYGIWVPVTDKFRYWCHDPQTSPEDRPLLRMRKRGPVPLRLQNLQDARMPLWSEAYTGVSADPVSSTDT